MTKVRGQLYGMVDRIAERVLRAVCGDLEIEAIGDAIRERCKPYQLL